MPNLIRIALVTVGLAVAGAVLGGLAAAVACGIYLGASFGVPHSVRELGVLTLPAELGAWLGFVLGPLVAFALLRTVPLGRVLLGATAGAFAGGLGSALVGIYPLYGAAAGLLAAAVALRGAGASSDTRLTRRPPRHNDPLHLTKRRGADRQSPSSAALPLRR